MKRIIFFNLILILFFPLTAFSKSPVTVYFFYGETCPHCQKAEPFFDSLEVKYPELIVNRYEIYYNEQNRGLYNEILAAYEYSNRYVPTIIIGEEVMTGYDSDQTTGKEIEAKIQLCIENGCINPFEKLTKKTEIEIVGTNQSNEPKPENQEPIVPEAIISKEQEDVNSDNDESGAETEGDIQKNININLQKALNNINLEMSDINVRPTNDESVYIIDKKEDVKFLGFIPIKINLEIKVDTDDGQVLSVKKPWWSFLVSGLPIFNI